MSRASKIVIDNATQQAIRQGKINLEHASPALRQAYLEIRHEQRKNKKGGFLSIFGSRNDDDEFDRISKPVLDTLEENKRLEKEHQQWVRQNRLSSVPKHWELLTADGNGQSYSDGSRIHYVDTRGRELDDYEELNRRYGSGD